MLQQHQQAVTQDRTALIQQNAKQDWLNVSAQILHATDW